MSPQDRQEKQEGLSKYLQRVKTVLRPRSTSKRQSLVVAPEVAGPAEATPPTPAPAPTLAQVPVPVQSTPAEEPIAPEPVVMTDYTITQHAKTRALFAKYGLTFEPSELDPPTDLQLTRVAKQIRIRVRRTCHRCETTFGAEKVCINCSHTRCTKCPRFPPARQPDEPQVRKPKVPETSAIQPPTLPMTTDLDYTSNPAHFRTLRSRTGGQDYVRNTARQRIRRTFPLSTTMCVESKERESSHVQRKKFPRDPAHLEKDPDDYPGDAEPPRAVPDRTFRKPRRRVRYLCHVCETAFLPHADTCLQCGQSKCAETIRIPPQKITREPDPEILRIVEERLATTAITVKSAITDGGD
ncbi:uncharacterized protein N7529_001424 [Penicillium soppii]|uniref:uncharacterized protein n=1 Tax=Penicillium soppii TaxID=69789 RepID=UPI0025494804|nr:uncharacterized protein N7529_001424 [Penicillium soppii]KAJ5875840.1 hypothetical protein N7529_001424 [Penicillium soppii]